VMVSPTIPVLIDSAQGSFEDMIDVGVDIIHPKLIVAVLFPVASVELTALRFRVDIAEAENALRRAKIRTTKAIEMVTHNHERHACIRVSWLRYKGPSVRTERTSGSSRSS
nr:hypothetical protein [Tanacetum cinerariifolium]